MKMNLVIDPWIPIIWQNGQSGLVGLDEAFQKGKDIQDLAVRPHERIALMRLLICVAQAALDGPEDRRDWQACGPRIVPAVSGYLQKWREVFELFGDRQRFLQSSGIESATERENSISKFDLALATGNNSTLFDNAGGAARVFMPAQMALMLLTFQCFSPGGRIGTVLWNGVTTGDGQSEHAPCVSGSMLHAYLRCSNLFDTIHFNLIDKQTMTLLAPKDGWGRPVWEFMPQSPVDENAVCNATASYLGRLVPLARVIRLSDDGISMILANGLSFPEWREPASTVKVVTTKGVPERKVVRVSLEKAPWRELHSLAVKRVSCDSNGGPVALQNLSGEESFDLWVGGLAADKAKPLDVLESVFRVPAGMLKDAGQKIYEEGVNQASSMGYRLCRAVSIYHKELGDNLDRAEMRDKRQRVLNKAAFQFWTTIERDVQRLLDVVADPILLANGNNLSRTAWGKALWSSASNAFNAACPHETPRQLKAFALARQVLFNHS